MADLDDPSRIALSPRRPSEMMAALKREQDAMRSQFLAAKSPDVALELLEVSVGAGVDDVLREAARTVLRRMPEHRVGAHLLARRVLDPNVPPGRGEVEESLDALSDERDLRARIRVKRSFLREFPRAALTWLELARIRTLLGDVSGASRDVRVAVSVAGRNRFVIRSGVRFFLHAGEPDAASMLLRRSELTPFDPWLMSAELAVSEILERPSGFIRKALGIVHSESHGPVHVSELAAGLGTLEARDGSIRKAKALMRLALRSPTENAVAQLEWLSREQKVMEFDRASLNLGSAHEATAWTALIDGRYADALHSARRWVVREPFSSRAVGLTALVAGVGLGQSDVAARALKLGLRANPRDASLRADMAFTLAESRRLIEAEQNLERVSLAGAKFPLRCAVTATRGLIAFRRGDKESGERLYGEAARIAAESKDRDLVGLVVLYWLAEQVRAAAGVATREEVEAVLNQVPGDGISERLAKQRVERAWAESSAPRSRTSRL